MKATTARALSFGSAETSSAHQVGAVIWFFGWLVPGASALEEGRLHLREGRLHDAGIAQPFAPEDGQRQGYGVITWVTAKQEAGIYGVI